MKLIDLFESPAALAHEQSIASKFKKKGATIWAEPMGSDAGWPDVGATFKLPSGTVHIHTEVKMNKTDPMGSLRKWVFDGNQFFAPNSDDNQQMLIDFMNEDPNVIDRANTLLELLQKYFHPNIREISSGVFSVIKDKQERYDQTLKFLNQAKRIFGGTGANFQLSNPKIQNDQIGASIIQHYKNKFRPLPGGYNIMLFALGDELFLVPPADLPENVSLELLKALGLRDLALMPMSFDGSIEVRAQARGLSKQGAKPTNLDVMASLRAPGLRKLKGTKF